MIIQSPDYYLDPLIVAPLFADQPAFAFLDSSNHKNNSGRYSIIAIEPFLTFIYEKGKVSLSSPLNYEDAFFSHFQGANDPFFVLSKLLDRFQFPELTSYPFPVGASIGYISYDLGASLEAKLPLSQNRNNWPDMEWGFYDILIIFDLHQKKIMLVSTGFPFKGDRQNQRAQQRLCYLQSLLDEIQEKQIHHTLENTYPNQNIIKEPPPIPSTIPLSSNFTPTTYKRAVQTIKNYIAQGDVYQVNLSQQFSGSTKEKGYDLYQRIRKINKVPYGGYLRFGQREIICFSMERFLRREGRDVQTRPIKGTRPRGTNEYEDQQQSSILYHSEKDRAELLMVVDMERNDLGKVCEYKSIRVDTLFQLEKYATVFHLVSTVSGRLRLTVDHLNCLLACFPGGSITGTPKIRSMEIIHELEKCRRDIYCGTIGYFGFNEISDFNIPIRTILKQGERFQFNAGGGVVIDSDPLLEYEETLHKVRSFLDCFSG